MRIWTGYPRQSIGKRLMLTYNYHLSNVSKLKEMKDQLEYLEINNTGISDSDRLELMRDNAISVPVGL